MKKNLKMFLLIAVCAMASCCLLYIREADEKQQIHSEKKEKEKLVFLTSKRETRHIFEKIIADFNESQDEIYVEHMAVPNPDRSYKYGRFRENFRILLNLSECRKMNWENM